MAEENRFIGTCLGNYRITAELGSGSFGFVYRAKHTILTERIVAIKLLHAHLAGPEERDRFLREARLLELLKHPNILHIIDVGIHSGFPYLVTEYAPYGSLRSLMNSYAPNPLPLQEALSVLTQVGQALDYAHQQNIIHRDLKPENILFNAQKEALLADFGIATTLSTSSIKNVTITGTPSYMAPEQFQSSVSRESDQYALGCIAYELFSGRPPFIADNFFSMGLDHLTKEPVTPAHYNPYIPPYIEQAILKAMSKQRHARYSDIHAFILALHQPVGAELSMPSQTVIQTQMSGGSIKSAIQTNQTPTLDAGVAFNRPQIVTQQVSNKPPFNIHVNNAQGNRNPFHQDTETPPPPVHPSFQGTAQLLLNKSFQEQNLDTLPSSKHVYPVTPIPSVAEVELQSSITQRPTLRQSPFERSRPGTYDNEPSNIHIATNSVFPAKQGTGRNWRRVIALASLLILVLISLYISIPLLFFHNSPQTRSTSGGQSTSHPLPGATVGTTATSVHTPTSHNQPARTPVTILNNVPTATPTLAPTTISNNAPTPTSTSVPTPTPTPITPTPTSTPIAETLTIYFINGTNGTSTVHSYTGTVTLHITGAGEEYTNKWDDAFYQYTDAHGNAITPYHTSVYPGWNLWINGSVADNYVSIPTYTSSHDYTVTMNAPGGVLTFAIGDTYPKDNSGYLTVTVTQG